MLSRAAINNRFEFIQLLLKRGADVNYTGGTLNENPLQWAVRDRRHCGTVLELIRAGSDLKHTSNVGMDALQVPCVRTVDT